MVEQNKSPPKKGRSWMTDPYKAIKVHATFTVVAVGLLGGLALTQARKDKENERQLLTQLIAARKGAPQAITEDRVRKIVREELRMELVPLEEAVRTLERTVRSMPSRQAPQKLPSSAVK
jgi:hypothetical protein